MSDLEPPDLDCWECQYKWVEEAPWPDSLLHVRMIVCPKCESKRCARALDHRNECVWGISILEPVATLTVSYDDGPFYVGGDVGELPYGTYAIVRLDDE